MSPSYQNLQRTLISQTSNWPGTIFWCFLQQTDSSLRYYQHLQQILCFARWAVARKSVNTLRLTYFAFSSWNLFNQNHVSPLKTSANFDNFWPLSPSVGSLFYCYPSANLDNFWTLPPRNADVLNGWSLSAQGLKCLPKRNRANQRQLQNRQL